MKSRHFPQREAQAALGCPPDALPADAAGPGPDPRPILLSVGEVVYHWDIASDRLQWGPNLAEVMGPAAAADLSTGVACDARMAAGGDASRYDAMMRASVIDRRGSASFRIFYALPAPDDDAPAVWFEDRGRWFAGADGRPAFAHGVVRVAPEHAVQQAAFLRASQTDPLTGLPSRAGFIAHVQRLLERDDIDRKPFAIVLVAVENFFAFNRAYGYDAGDDVLAALARRLRANVCDFDFVARHAGNKFALALLDCDTDETRAVANRLIDVVNATAFETSAGCAPATIRVGAVIAPRDGRTPQTLFQRAEEALDAARQHNGHRYVAYAASLARDDTRLQALHVADNIVTALNEQRVELAFQPVVRAATGEIAFHEALLRLRLPDGSTMAPDKILPFAEKAGLLRLLDQRVMKLALDRLSRDPALNVSINCATASLLDPEWPDGLINAAARDAGVARRLIIEITEATMIEDHETTRRLIASCKSLGVRVAMDDFGAGHTSFRNLRDFDFDLVKIDGAFVQNMLTSEDDRFFVRTLLDLAKHLSLETVAEYVEDEETARLLRDWGVDYFQGAHYGRAQAHPAPSDETR